MSNPDLLCLLAHHVDWSHRSTQIPSPRPPLMAISGRHNSSPTYLGFSAAFGPVDPSLLTETPSQFSYHTTIICRFSYCFSWPLFLSASIQSLSVGVPQSSSLLLLPHTLSMEDIIHFLDFNYYYVLVTTKFISSQTSPSTLILEMPAKQLDISTKAQLFIKNS